MKSWVFIVFSCIILVTGCGNQVNNELIEELEAIAVNYVKNEYQTELVIEIHEVRPPHVVTSVVFYGHDKLDDRKKIVISIDYKTKE